MRRIVFITSLLAFFSPAAVNYAVADCRSEFSTCETQRCGRESGHRLEYCLDECRFTKTACLAKEERRKITCTPSQGNVQRCVQHGQDLETR
jgi:hypothetical protein